MTHFKTVCEKHGTVLAQCRCPDPHKEQRLVECPGTCTECEHQWQWTDENKTGIACLKCKFEFKISQRPLTPVEREALIEIAMRITNERLANKATEEF